jgi:hypothetical protein
LKNIGDILSGKRWKENKIAVYAQTEPRERFAASDVASVTEASVAKNFSDALAFSTWAIVVRLVLAKRPYIASLAKSLDADSLRRLCAFVAWYIAQFYVEDARIVAESQDEADSIAAATSAALNVMYPRDAVSEKAIGAYIAAEQKILEQEDGAVQTPELDAVRIAIGLSPLGWEVLESKMLDHISVSTVLQSSMGMLAEVFLTFQGERQ